MAAQNPGNPIPSERFSWHPETKTFSAEESTLRDGPRTVRGPDYLCQRIYPDAYDTGFPMRSAQTGKVAWFAHSGTDTHEGDIAGWHFVPTSEAIRDNPALEGVRVLVIND
jgi:hypothetical protein